MVLVGGCEIFKLRQRLVKSQHNETSVSVVVLQDVYFRNARNLTSILLIVILPVDRDDHICRLFQSSSETQVS